MSEIPPSHTVAQPDVLQSVPAPHAAQAKPQPDRETKALLHWLSASKSTPISQLTPQVARENYKNSLTKTDIVAPDVAEITTKTILGVDNHEIDLRIYWPLKQETQNENALHSAILFYHGGGCVFGDLDTHEPLCCTLCADSEAVVISVDYRLAPEHNFPAPILDGISALSWLIDNAASLKIDPERIAIAGDSAGGGVATTVIQESIDKIDITPCAQLLIYPAIDVTGKTNARSDLADMFPVTADTLEWFFNHYFGPAWPLHDKRAHPMKYEAFAKIPTLIITAGLDPLHEEAVLYGQKMETHSVPVSYKHYEGTIHGFMGMGRLLRKAHNTARNDIAAFLKAHL